MPWTPKKNGTPTLDQSNLNVTTPTLFTSDDGRTFSRAYVANNGDPDAYADWCSRVVNSLESADASLASLAAVPDGDVQGVIRDDATGKATTARLMEAASAALAANAKAVIG